MFEEIPKELHELRKMQMDKLKKARKVTVNVRILVNPSLTSFSLMGDKSSFNGILVSIHNGEVVRK